MAGPWEDFQSSDTATEEGPWQDFQADTQAPWEDFKATPKVDAESLPAVVKDIYQNAGKRLTKLGEQLKTEFTSGEAVKPIGGGLPTIPHTADESAISGYAKAAYNAPAGLINAVITPAGLATVGSFAVGQPEIGAALIAAQMAPGAASMAKHTVEAATGQLPPGESAEAALNLGLVAAPLVHGVVPKTPEFTPVETASKPEFPVDKTGVTEPPLVPKEFTEPPKVTTSDLTLKLVDARKGLLERARFLQGQADISKAATGQVHPAIELEINAINEELNHPTVGVPVDPDSPLDTIVTNEATQRVAESPVSTTPGEISAGQQPVEPSGEVGLGVGPESTMSSQERGVPVEAGMSRASIESDIENGVLPLDALVVGKGWNPTQAATRGDYLLNQGVNPEAVLDAIRGRRAFPKDVKKPEDAVAVLASERRRLGAERAAAVNQYGIGSPQAKLAQAAEVNWLKQSRPIAGGVAQKIMMTFQDAEPVDLGTFDGMYKKAIEFADGKDIPEGQQIQMMRQAKKLQSARTGVEESIKQRDQVLERHLPKVKTPTETEITSLVDDLVKELTPCK